MTDTSFSSGFQVGAEINRKRDERTEQNRQRIAARLEKFGQQMTEAFLENNETARNTIIDSFAQDFQQTYGRKANANFISFLKKNPDDAGAMLQEIGKSGVSPSVFFELEKDPLLLGQAVLAMGKAKREREARTERGSGGEAPQSTSAPFVSAPAAVARPAPAVSTTPVTATGTAGKRPAQAPAPTDTESPSGFDEEAAASAPTVAPAPTPVQAAAPTVTSDSISRNVVEIRQRIARNTAKINNLASMGRPEAEIKPFRDEMMADRKSLLDLETSSSMKQRDEQAVLEVRPITGDEYTKAKDQLIAQGRRDLANRLRVGMNRRSFESVMKEGGVSGAAAGPATGVQSTEEEEEKKKRMVEQIEGTERVASKNYEKFIQEGEDARKRDNAYLAIRTMLNTAGPTGKFQGPIRDFFLNVASMFGAKPEALPAIQTIEAHVSWLASQVLRDFSGPDSDKDVLRAIAMQPSITKTRGANELLIDLAMQENHRMKVRAANANKWVGQYRSLAGKDELGQNFNQWWGDYASRSLPTITYDMLQRAGIDSRKVWKQKPNDVGKEGP